MWLAVVVAAFAVVCMVLMTGWNQHDCIIQHGNWDGTRCSFSVAQP